MAGVILSVPKWWERIPINFSEKQVRAESMKSITLSKEETKLIEVLRAHPALAGQAEAVLAVVRAGGEAPGTIDAGEESLVKPLRALGLAQTP